MQHHNIRQTHRNQKHPKLFAILRECMKKKQQPASRRLQVKITHKNVSTDCALCSYCVAVVAAFLFTLSHVWVRVLFFSSTFTLSVSLYYVTLVSVYNLCNNMSIIYHLFELSLNGNKNKTKKLFIVVHCIRHDNIPMFECDFIYLFLYAYQFLFAKIGLKWRLHTAHECAMLFSFIKYIFTRCA